MSFIQSDTSSAPWKPELRRIEERHPNNPTERQRETVVFLLELAIGIIEDSGSTMEESSGSLCDDSGNSEQHHSEESNTRNKD